MSPGHARVLAGAACLLGLAAPAAAEQIIAVDPPPPPPPPEYPLPLPPAPVPQESFVVVGSAVQSWISGTERLEQLGRGANLSFTWLQRDGEFPSGVDMSGLFLRGEDASVYALSMRLMGSAKVGRRALVPFAAFGIGAGLTRLEMDVDATKASEVQSGWALGPSAAIGLHGFLSDSVYWRGQAGFVGVGAGALTADLGLGFVID
jgi:hypothetical protein